MPLPYINIPDQHIGPIPIHPFGVLVATGVLIGSAMAVRRAQRHGLPRANMESFISWTLAFGFVLSHVLDELMYRPREVLAHPLQLLMIWRGISSYGGFIGGVIGAFVWAAFKKEKILPYLEEVGAVFPVAWIFGRAGCSVAHDHIGNLSSSPLAVNFPGAPRFDLGLLELFCTIPLAIATLWYARKPRRPGEVLGFISLVYAPIRYGLDSMRATDISSPDARYFGLTPGMWLSVVLLVTGVVLLLRARKLPARTWPAPAAPAPEAPASTPTGP